MRMTFNDSGKFMFGIDSEVLLEVVIVTGIFTLMALLIMVIGFVLDRLSDKYSTKN